MPADSIAATAIPRVRFAAIGDSFTEGVGDPRPDGNMRGWADLVAEGLALAHGEPIAYANFAIRGRLLGPIVDDQLPAALRLDPAPTILTINGGGNDMLRRGCDPAFLHSKTEQAVVDGAASGARVVLLSGADPSAQLPFGSTIHQRGEQLTDMVAEIAAATTWLSSTCSTPPNCAIRPTGRPTGFTSPPKDTAGWPPRYWPPSSTMRRLRNRPSPRPRRDSSTMSSSPAVTCSRG